MTDQNNTSTLVISGGLEFSREISTLQAVEIVQILLGGSRAPHPAPSPLSTGVSSDKNNGGYATPTEAIQSSKAKNNSQRISALAKHHLEVTGEQEFQISDIKPLFRKARLTAPKNLNRDLDTAIKAGLIADSGNGKYYLTSRGSGQFGEEGRKTKTKASKPSKQKKPNSRKKIEVPEVFKDIATFPVVLEGYKPYRKLKTDTDRLLWILLVAKKNNVKSLTNLDIGWLGKRLGHALNISSLTATYNANQRKGFASKSTQGNKISITKEGELSLKIDGDA